MKEDDMRNMSLGFTPPYGDKGDDLYIDYDPARGRSIQPAATALTTRELEELARIVLARLSADLDDIEAILDDARDARADHETSQEQRYDG